MELGLPGLLPVPVLLIKYLDQSRGGVRCGMELQLKEQLVFAPF